MGKAKLAILITLTLILSLSTIGHGADESSLVLGAEFGLHPRAISLVVDVDLADQVELEFTAGGYTQQPFKKGVFRGKVDARYTFLESKFSPYLQGGIGYFYLHKIEEFPYKNIREIHLRGGLEYSFSKNFAGRGDLGIFWAPHPANPEIEKQYPDNPFINFLANLGVMFSLPIR